jgi:hypothetical protein
MKGGAGVNERFLGDLVGMPRAANVTDHGAELLTPRVIHRAGSNARAAAPAPGVLRRARAGPRGGTAHCARPAPAPAATAYAPRRQQQQQLAAAAGSLGWTKTKQQARSPGPRAHSRRKGDAHPLLKEHQTPKARGTRRGCAPRAPVELVTTSQLHLDRCVPTFCPVCVLCICTQAMRSIFVCVHSI